MWKYRLYYFSKYAKYIGVAALCISFINNSDIFHWLSIFGLAAIIELVISFPILKCSIQQIIGISKANKRYGSNMPNKDNYTGDIRYDLPFEGEWTVVNGCFTEEYSHSWVIPIQRYAYDFLMIDDNGKSYDGNPREMKNYYCYDKVILAPADGEVVKLVNNARDSLILKNGKFYNTARHIAGNYMIIKHNEHEYSMLAHLKKDSMTVKVGDKVLRGQKIAACGNTGNSSEPHLHFQVQNGPDFNNSVGLPIRFRNVIINVPSNYGKMDPRPHMDVHKIPEGFITRGYNVYQGTVSE